MADPCRLKGCDQPALPPTFWRDETVKFVTGKSGKAKGGLGLCEDHDAQMTALQRHRRQVSKLHNSQPDPSIVYFIYGTRPGPFANLIKIGTSDNLDPRRSQLGGKLLAVEPGGRQREGQLHARFWHLWVTGEWYRPNLELIAYIQSRQEGKDMSEFELDTREGSNRGDQEQEWAPLGELAAWHSCNLPDCQGECQED